MLTLGLLSTALNPENEYFTEIAIRSSDYDITIVYFAPQDIKPDSELVQGLLFDTKKKEWKKATFPIPNYLYDRCFYNNEQSLKSKPVVEWLKKRPNTFFLGHGLPNKLQTYDVLSKHSTLKPYLPKTSKVDNEKSVLQFTMKEKEIVLKPINGSNGQGIYFITYTKDEIEVKMQRGEKVITKTFEKDLFMRFIQSILAKKDYMMQPYLHLNDKNNCPFDIRIFVQKGKDGKWTARGIGIRRGAAGNLISNLSSGSTIETYESWAQTHPKNDITFIKDEIRTILKNLPEYLEKETAPLFEIGIDIGVDKNNAVWLLDINSKPGRKVLLETNPTLKEELYTAPLTYCQFLSKSSVKKG